MSLQLLFLDTETGGLDPFKHSLLQIGVIAYIDNQIKESLEISLSQKEYVVTAEALKFNQLDLYEDIKKNGYVPEKATQMLIEFVQNQFTETPILVGHNPSIDKYMVRQLFDSQNLNMDNYISHRMIDTMSLIWGLYIAGKLPIEACSSNGAFKYFGIEVEKKHHALDDCLATVRLYEKLINLLK